MVAIEPDCTNFALLKKNVQKSNCNNVFLYNVACYDKDCILVFSLEGPSINRRIIDRNVNHITMKVKARTLDSIIKELETQIAFSNLILKIDVEGSEHHVILGAKETIEKYRPIIVLEVWEPYFNMIVKFLNNYGYEYKNCRKGSY